MTKMFPSSNIAKKFARVTGALNTQLDSTITVPTTEYGVVYRLWASFVALDTEADLEALPTDLVIKITIGSLIWQVTVHPLIAHADTQKFRYVDLGPWSFDFGPDGLYSGVKGDDIVFVMADPGVGVRDEISFLYSGD